MFPGAASKIFIDPDAFLILPQHIEEDLAKNHNGPIRSTGKGVTPAYRDKIGRCGVRVRSLIRDNNEVIIAMEKLGVQFRYIMELREEMEKSRIIFEGAQSVLLDIHSGCYPYVTSGDCGLAGIINSGFATMMPKKIYGACKCYCTKVGGGFFPTEIFGEEATKIQSSGKEIGATTGRLRSVGWLDLPALKYAIIKSGMNALIISKLDILNGYSSIKVCTAYEQGDLMCGANLAEATPIYTDVPGWQDASDPQQIRHFISMVEQHVGVPVEYVSTGVGEKDFRPWIKK
jgi:adenylosuccinate synthase